MAILEVRVVPGAKKSEVVGRYGEGIKLRIAAPPEDGRANAALVEFLAERLGVARQSVRLVRGQSSRQKALEVKGVTLDDVMTRLGV